MLTVTGKYNDGITGKDGLVIAGGTIVVEAADDAVRGKDYLVVKGGSLTVKAGGDGLKADNAEDTALGFVTILDGTLAITAATSAYPAVSRTRTGPRPRARWLRPARTLCC